MKHCRNLIIFCQAPADAKYVIKIYKQYRDSHQIFLYIITVIGIYDFFKTINLPDLHIFFIPYPKVNFRSIISLTLGKLLIIKTWKKHFRKFDNGEVYFFSRFEDWFTASFISRFSKKKGITIFYYNHYDDENSLNFPNRNENSLRIKIYRMILYYLANTSFHSKIKSASPEFAIEKYHLNIISGEFENNELEEHLYKIDTINKNKAILFFINPCNRILFEENDYKKRLQEISLICRSHKFVTYVKGHPRMGVPLEIASMFDYTLPYYIPSEFIDHRSFALIIGIDSNAICYFASSNFLPVYSIIYLFKSINTQILPVYVKTLNKKSNNKIEFIRNLKNFEKIICNNSTTKK